MTMIGAHTIRLSIALSRSDFKLRNEGSYLGTVWYLLFPLVTFIILYAVFSRNLGSNIPSYPLYLLLGIILYNAFRQVTVESTRILYDNRLLIKSIHFPRESLVGAVLLRVFYGHIFETVVFFAIVYFAGSMGPHMALYVIIAGMLFVFTFGVALILASISVYVQDIENIWSVVTQALLFATPIFYTLENNPYLTLFNILNPLYYYITIARDLLIYGLYPDVSLLLGTVFFSVLAAIFGLQMFRMVIKRVAERF